MSSPSNKKPTSQQHGKRGDPSYAQVAGMIPLELRRRFKAKVALKGEDMSRVLEHPHRDPFDRMLAAQAILEDIAVVSRDGVLAELGAVRVW